MARTLDERSVHEYQKLIATGLACLEVAIAGNKLTPRLEALARLRYANILCTETNNIMEAETALTKGITLCERVCGPAPRLLCMRMLTAYTTEPIHGPQVLYAILASPVALLPAQREGRSDRCRHTDPGC